MGTHHAAIFWHWKYQDEVAQLVELADHRDYELLKQRVCQIIRQFQNEWPLSSLGEVKYVNGVGAEIRTQEWPLFEHGEEGLATIEEIEVISMPSSQDLGYWFLIILAKYVGNCIAPLGNWHILYTVLKSLGWSSFDCDLLFHGFPTYKLLKPSLVEQSIKPLTDKSPYWLWVQPSRAWSGWLPSAEVERLLEKLSHVKDQVKSWDVSEIPNIDVSNPIVIKEYQEYLRKGFDDALAMLSVAQQNQAGLFMSITI